MVLSCLKSERLNERYERKFEEGMALSVFWKGLCKDIEKEYEKQKVTSSYRVVFAPKNHNDTGKWSSSSTPQWENKGKCWYCRQSSHRRGDCEEARTDFAAKIILVGTGDGRFMQMTEKPSTIGI